MISINGDASLFNLEFFENRLKCSKSRFISVGDVEEAIRVTFLFIDLCHQGVALEQILAVHKEIQRVLLWQLDSLANDIVEMVSSQIVRDQVPIIKGGF